VKRRRTDLDNVGSKALLDLGAVSKPDCERQVSQADHGRTRIEHRRARELSVLF